MPHQILYEHIGGEKDDFRSFRVVWEPYTDRVALRFRSPWEVANGLVGTPEETIRYLDSRAETGAPWDSGAPREARQRLAALLERGRMHRVPDAVT